MVAVLALLCARVSQEGPSIEMGSQQSAQLRISMARPFPDCFELILSSKSDQKHHGTHPFVEASLRAPQLHDRTEEPPNQGPVRLARYLHLGRVGWEQTKLPVGV